MADYFDSAQTQADASKAALLAAITQYGSQAHQALQAGQDQLAAARQAAIGQQLGTGQQMDAPAALQNELSARISAPYDQRIASLGTEAASRQAGFDNQAAGANTYMTEANAALPAIRGQLAQKVATLQAQAQAQLEKDRQDQAMQALTFQQGQTLKNIELQIAQANLAKAQQSGAAGGNLSSIVSQLGGTDLAGGQLSNALVGSGEVQRGVPGAQGGSLVAQSNRAAVIGSPEDQFDPTQRLSDYTGLPGAAIGQLVGGYQNKQAAAQAKADAAANPDLVDVGRNVGLSVPGVQQMMASPEYQKAQQLAESIVQAGGSVDALKAALGQAKELNNKPKTRAAIIYLYGKQLTSPNYIPTG